MVIDGCVNGCPVIYNVFHHAPKQQLLPALMVNRTRLLPRCLTPTYSSWANPIEAQFGPLRTFTMANSNYPNHTVLTYDLHAYLCWRNANARHPDVLAAQRRERARIRGERQQRWGRRSAA
jgi:hypothetical protein